MLPSPPAEMDHHPVTKRKRSRSDIEAEESCDRSFQLQHLATSSCLSFEPISKLLRAHLPLSWLASTTSIDALPAGTLLQGYIKHVTTWDYSVLVARCLPNGGLFVFEKVDQDCLVSYPLQPFVTVQWVQDASIGASPPVNMQMLMHYMPATEPMHPKVSRRTPSLTSDPLVKLPTNRRGAAARRSILSQIEKQEDPTPSPTLHQILVHDEDNENGLTTTEISQLGAQDGDPVQSELPTTHTESSIIEPPVQNTLSQSDMLSPAYLRQRYLETLYIAKTPLTFYTKGPLSRARVRSRVTDASMTPLDLASFYRESVLPTRKLELKYKESIRESISKIILDSNADQNTKKKPTKKTKLGKTGLWPVEGDYIERWWKGRTLNPAPTAQQEVEIENAIKVLRMREIQMQIIVILEALAIESKQVTTAHVDDQSTKQPMNNAIEPEVKSIEHAIPSVETPKTTAKKRNLETDLEVLACKLCIYHCVELDNSVLSNTVSNNHNPENDCGQVDSKDQLREFCTTVLIPFYSSRLPVQCKSLCKTLADSEIFDQAQKATRMHHGSVQPIAPGVAIKRQPPSRSNTIERLPDEDHRQSSPPVLNRSSTLPPVPQFKREPSEVSQRPFSRQTSVTFSGREVDLVADAKATASKRRKLDLVAAHKQEMSAAIQALKKPNRQSAGKMYMDEIEQRRASRTKPVLITATPRGNRRKQLHSHEDDYNVLHIQSKEIAIPSSGVKSKVTTYSRSVSASSSKKKAVLAAIYETPSRGASKKSDPLQLSNELTRMSFSEVASKQNWQKGSAATSGPSCASTIFSTPVKEKPDPFEHGTGFDLPDVALRTMDRAMAMPVSESIYDIIGWNEDDECET